MTPGIGLALAIAGNLRSDRLQAGLVAIGQRQVAAAQRKFQGQRAANAARCSRHRRGGSLDRGHVGSFW